MATMHQHTINTPYIVGEVHCYSKQIGDETVLFDCGPPTDEALAALQTQLDISRIKYLFLTHCHIDHYGLASRIANLSGARIFIPRADAVKMRHRSLCSDYLVSTLSSFGFDGEVVRQTREKSAQEHQKVHLPADVEIVEESDLPAQLGIRVLSCPGHSQSDLVYICGDDAVSGDILLRNIFQVPVLDLDQRTLSTRFRNYDAYCESLVALEQVKGCRILPGHRWYVENLEATVRFYVGKLLGRAELVKNSADAPSMAELVRRLYGDILRNPFFVHMKVSEILFTLDFLTDPGRLRSALETLGLFDDMADQYHHVVNGYGHGNLSHYFAA
jgi:2,4-dienoyl-CoA reductase (NADPH2)